MVNYSCEICNKIFTQKSHYNQHQKRKTKCNNNDEKLKNIINQVIDNKINLLINTKKIELNIFNNIINNDNNNNNNMIVSMNNEEIVNNNEIIIPIPINKKKNKITKQILGQFYTTNQEYILQGMNIPNNIKNIIEPFTGNGDLITFIEK